MPFAPFDYLHFARFEMSGAAHALCLSGVPEISTAALLGTDGSGLPAAWEDTPDVGERWRAAIGARYGVAAEECLPAMGTSGAVFVALGALTSLVRDASGGAPVVAVERPAYGVFAAAARFLGCSLATFERSVEDAFAVDPERVDRAFADGAQIVCLTNLHNPSGVALPSAIADALREIAERHGGWIVLDEVYRDFVSGPVGTDHHAGDRIVAMGSLTKVYGLSAPRCGWIFAAPEVITRADHVVEIAHGVDPAPSLAATVAGLERAEELRAAGSRLADRARPVMDAWIAATPGVSWAAPAAGLTGLVQVEGLTDSHAFARRLRTDLDVQVVAGAYFGVDDAIRISFGLPPAALQRALETLALGLGALV